MGMGWVEDSYSMGASSVSYRHNVVVIVTFPVLCQIEL